MNAAAASDKAERVAISLYEIERKSRDALVAHGVGDWIADEVAKAIRKAEATGNVICGLYYLESYCKQAVFGRLNATAEPVVTVPKPASVAVDAKYGFAQSAFARGFETALEAARANGLCGFAICHAHTCTSLGYFTEQIARAGFIGIGFTNASAVVAPPGGNAPVLGTNPIAMSVPRTDGTIAFQFDHSTSAVALGKITMAAAAGESIPHGWAVDSNGKPTTDPKEALKGALVSAGGYKGYSFGLMAEMLAAALTGGVNSVDVKALKAPEGKPHDLGQFYLLIDPQVFAGDAFWQRLEVLRAEIAKQEGARLPGSTARNQDPVLLDAALWAHVLQLAGGAP